MRNQLQIFFPLTDTPAVAAAAPALIITSGTRLQPLPGVLGFASALTVLCSVGQDGASLQALVAQVDGRVVGVLIMEDEQVGALLLSGSPRMLTLCLGQELEYIRGHYNIENFIYFSRHCRKEHARMRHFVLRLPFQHLTKHLLKEAFRLSHKSCLYHRMYPPQRSQEVGARALVHVCSVTPLLQKVSQQWFPSLMLVMHQILNLPALHPPSWNHPELLICDLLILQRYRGCFEPSAVPYPGYGGREEESRSEEEQVIFCSVAPGRLRSPGSGQQVPAALPAPPLHTMRHFLSMQRPPLPLLISLHKPASDWETSPCKQIKHRGQVLPKPRVEAPGRLTLVAWTPPDL